jgi:hypothetical protein
VLLHTCPFPECVGARFSSESMRMHFVMTHDLPPERAAQLTAAFVLRLVRQNPPPVYAHESPADKGEPSHMPEKWKKTECPACHTSNVSKTGKVERTVDEPTGPDELWMCRECNLIFTFVNEATSDYATLRFDLSDRDLMFVIAQLGLLRPKYLCAAAWNAFTTEKERRDATAETQGPIVLSAATYEELPPEVKVRLRRRKPQTSQ